MKNRPEWLDRVLAYDELPDTERAEVRAFLDENEDARRLLERVRAAEAEATALGELPERSLTAAEARAAEESLAALLRKHAAERSSVGTRPRAIGRLADFLAGLFRPRVLVPVAVAAAVVLLLLPRESRLGPPIIVHSSEPRGVDAERPGWRTGDAFVLRCEVPRPSALILVHVDPQGEVAVLVPATEEDAERIYGPGKVELPGPGDEWVFQGSTGTETFLLAAGDRTNAEATRSIVKEVRRATDHEDDRKARIREITRILESFGEVRATSVDHRPA